MPLTPPCDPFNGIKAVTIWIQGKEDLERPPEDVEELRKRLPRRKRPATDPPPEGECIPVALKGVALDHLEGRPLGAALIGPYTTDVIGRNSRDSRVLAGEMRVLEVFHLEERQTETRDLTRRILVASVFHSSAIALDVPSDIKTSKFPYLLN
ncbi:uncharacterized protein NECHADRAFT_79630 [Fusarium vanettenii 77-13-4]|uniref:Uncharacterized protein n=1 Tax=Fusarium vanettenii (strain ATCC MYA-4622 / CBS 123669 / FGSC 9596 / NRRL 45880 / 77-13-4) TaxID=660122 RepID=C7Z815_FUSV7|nr:uncharacterized protein NECHADRAFT_79630 [Fusarium vanettenii 77-13-4]EEU39922.1 predicted protein [Fusarium vanettenii 77-13-4]